VYRHLGISIYENSLLAESRHDSIHLSLHFILLFLQQKNKFIPIGMSYAFKNVNRNEKVCELKKQTEKGET